MGFSAHDRCASEHRTMVCTLITLDRPDKRDAADEQMRTGPAETRTDAAADRWTRVVVATGAGRTFSAEAPLGGGGQACFTSHHAIAAGVRAYIRVRPLGG